MTNELSIAGLTYEIWSEKTALNSCRPLKELYQNVLGMKGAKPQELFKELKGLLDPNLDKDAISGQIVFTLANLAIKTINVSESLFSAMDSYEYPESKGNLDFLYSYSPFTTLESQLPRCDFNHQNPINKERFVVCQQASNYFSELITASILSKCKINPFDDDQLPFKYPNLGAYLVYSEDSDTKVKGRTFSSWKIRDQWDHQMKVNFCNSHAQDAHCKEETLETPRESPRTYSHWVTHIYPTAKKSCQVYNTKILNEIDAVISARKEARNTFLSKAHSFQKSYNSFFVDTAGNLSKARKDSNIIRTIVLKGIELENLLKQFNEKQSMEKWEELQTIANEMHTFIKDHSLQKRYIDIEQNIALAHSARPPEYLFKMPEKGKGEL